MTVPYTFANATGNIPLAQLDANFANVGGYANTSGTVTTNAQPNITTVGTLSYLSVTGNITSAYFIGNGSQLTGIVANSSYSNANVQSYLPTYTGNLAGGNVITTGLIQALGNISGNFFVGNGSQLTGITGNYSNTNVASYLTTYTGNISGDTVTANFFVGDGSGLTNLPAGNYSNANVADYLPTYTGNLAGGNLSITGNTQSGNLLTGGIVSAVGNVRGSNFNTGGNVSAAGNVIGLFLYGDGSNISNLPAGNYGNANVEAYLPTSNTIISINSNIANTDSNVANLSNALANTNSNVGNLVTITTNTDSNVANLVNALANTDSNVANLSSALSNTNSNVSNVASNVTTLQGQVYSDSNVATYLTTYTGNISAGNISVTGNIYGNIVGNILTTPAYGSFYDTTTQTNSNVGNGIPMTFNTTDINNQITIAGGNTQITIGKTGIYNIQFSAQINKTGGGADNIYVWLDKNGNSVSNSATAVYLVGNNSKIPAAWNFVVSAAAGDYYRLMWEAGSADIEILAEAAAGDVPAIPSVILTVVPVGA